MKRFNARSIAGKALLNTLLTSVLLLVLSAFTLTTTASAAELVANGGFEVPVVNPDYGWATYFGENYSGSPNYCPPISKTCINGTLAPGWDVFWTDDLINARQLSPGRLEIQTGDTSNIPAFEGLQKAELDSHHRPGNPNKNITISQFLPTCPGADYTLTYAWKSRIDGEGHENDNDVRVYIDTTEVNQHKANRDWLVETVYFTADYSGETLILFGSIGDETTTGMFLDNISVTADGEDLENCSPICGNKPKKITLRYDGDDDSDHNQSGNEVTITTPTADFPEMATIKVYGHKWKRPQYLGSFDRKIGEFLTVSGPRNRIPPRLTFEIYDYQPEEDDLPIQTVTFHTSCSQPLESGDEFGAITVWSAVN
jgi:hypothetical protein